MTENEFKAILVDQNYWKQPTAGEIDRTVSHPLVTLCGYALIVTGIRRCGKSTLLRQILRKEKKHVLHLHFEDYRFANFELRDFAHIDKFLKEKNINTILFDEVQNIEGWELYVRQKLDQGLNVYITGSNATLLSKELGSKLTGRNITFRLSPFSFSEYCKIKKVKPSPSTLRTYLDKGGLPEFLKTDDTRLLNRLIDDILVRDIAQRYKIQDVRSLKVLCEYLFQNIGNLVSPSKLTAMLRVKSPRTVLDYCAFLSDSYLIHLVPVYSHSRKAQELAPKKIYAEDNALCRTAIPPDKEDYGHLLENAVFCHLQNTPCTINYLKTNDAECDFVVTNTAVSPRAIQVCAELTHDNIIRETRGLEAAMKTLGINEGTIVTLNTTDTIYSSTGTIHIVPAHTFLYS